MAITTQFLTGFEHGFLSSLGGGLFSAVVGGVTVSTSSPRNGSYCGHLVTPDLTAAYLAFTVAGNPTKLVLRFGVKVSTRPSPPNTELLSLRNSAAAFIGKLNISSGGTLNLVFGGTQVIGPLIDTTSWHLIELQADCVAKTCDWKVDGVAKPQVASSGTTVDIANVYLGVFPTSLSSLTADYDDLIFGTWTNAATDWYGDGKVLAQRAGVDGTHATITSLSPGDAGAAYSGTPTTVNTMVDDPPGTLGWTATRSTTDNIALRTATVGAYASIGPATTAETGSANAVRALMSYSSSTTTANRAACDVRNSAGAVTELWGLTGGVGQVYSLVANQFKAGIVTRPAAGWTAAEVNAVRFRFGGCTSVDVNPVPTVQAMMLEVDWPPAAASLDLSAAAGLATFVGDTTNVEIGARTFPNMVTMAPASH